MAPPVKQGRARSRIKRVIHLEKSPVFSKKYSMRLRSSSTANPSNTTWQQGGRKKGILHKRFFQAVVYMHLFGGLRGWGLWCSCFSRGLHLASGRLVHLASLQERVHLSCSTHRPDEWGRKLTHRSTFLTTDFALISARKAEERIKEEQRSTCCHQRCGRRRTACAGAQAPLEIAPPPPQQPKQQQQRGWAPAQLGEADRRPGKAET